MYQYDSTKRQYKLICMGFDGDYVTDAYCDSIDSAWEKSNDLGSKWYFYPFHFVLTPSGKSIASTPTGLEHMKGKRLSTIQSLFKSLSEFPENKNANVDSFFLDLQHTEL